jgi:L-alanine-DL-glutamate epimerase-like enolase superfamily enzyme
MRGFPPFFEAQAVDCAVIDAVWNGVWESMRIAAVAEAHEVNVAPHNFYGHLATLMNVHFAAAVPNLRTMEVDPERIPLDESLFTATPVFDNGELVVQDAPGWGTEPIEDVIRAHPPRDRKGIFE